MNMHRLFAPLLILASTGVGRSAQPTVAPTGTLRAAYLANNPAQARTDSQTGALRGVVVDLVREWGRRLGVKTTLTGIQSPQSVIDAVRNGQADIGFVAYNPERAGPVQFSRPYLLVQQTFVVRQDSPIQSVTDIDRPDRKIGAGKGDSIALYLARTLKQARLVETTEPTVGETLQAVVAGRIDAFGANRQRLTDAVKGVSGLRLLADDLYGVEQTIVVPNGNPQALKAANDFIDDVRRSGFLGDAIDRSGVIGIVMAK
jgi:polar amino acid transport system substrate-binding protein